MTHRHRGTRRVTSFYNCALFDASSPWRQNISDDIHSCKTLFYVISKCMTVQWSFGVLTCRNVECGTRDLPQRSNTAQSVWSLLNYARLRYVISSKKSVKHRFITECVYCPAIWSQLVINRVHLLMHYALMVWCWDIHRAREALASSCPMNI